MDNKTIFDYEIATEKLDQPIGGLYHYMAKIASLYRIEGEKITPMQHGIVEVWGITETDARQKIIERTKQWLDTHI